MTVVVQYTSILNFSLRLVNNKSLRMAEVTIALQGNSIALQHIVRAKHVLAKLSFLRFPKRIKSWDGLLYWLTDWDTKLIVIGTLLFLTFFQP